MILNLYLFSDFTTRESNALGSARGNRAEEKGEQEEGSLK